LCLSYSLALHFFQLFFSFPLPCLSGLLASPWICNGLWLHSYMAVFSSFFCYESNSTPLTFYSCIVHFESKSPIFFLQF
jgi:hypothetical protein